MAQKTFKGYGITDVQKWKEFSVIEYPSKKWAETDVEVAITHCGVCASDVHTLSSGWGAIQAPLVVGHEIAGMAIRVGSEVKGIKVGDRVGVGAQIASCYNCALCTHDNENYCPNRIDTYGGKYPDGVRTFGGYSTGIIADYRYVFPIPDGLGSADTCSMLCGGLTVYSPLVRNGAGPGKKVGVIGIGGLGHYAILFAKALGCEVYAFSHSSSKEADCRKMGVDHYIPDSPGFEKNYQYALDIIICTRDAVDGFPLQEYLSTLNVHGKFICVALPEKAFPPITGFTLLNNGCYLGGSHIGSKKEGIEMMQLAAEKGIKPWIQEMPMKDCEKAIEGMLTGKPRYRYVLTQDLYIRSSVRLKHNNDDAPRGQQRYGPLPMPITSAAHPAHGTQGFLLLTLNNVEAILPGSSGPIIDQLALECVTLPENPSSFLSEVELERDVWLILRVGPNEMAISPTQVIRHFRSERMFIFEAGANPVGTESKWILKLPVPRNRSDTEDQETFGVLLEQYSAVEAIDSYGSPPAYSEAITQSPISISPHSSLTKRPVPPPPTQQIVEKPPLPPRSVSPGLPHEKLHNDDLRGRLVLVDENDGELVGTLGEQYNIREDNALQTRGHEKDPVIVDIPADGDTTRAENVYVYPVPLDQQDSIMKTASIISRGMVLATDAINAGIGAASSLYVTHAKPNEKPLEFSDRTRGNVRRMHKISGKAVEVTAKTTGLIHGALERAVGHISGSDKKKAKSGATTPTPSAPGSPPPRLPLKNRLFLATDMLLTTAENSAKQLLEHGTMHVSEALGHKYGNDMREASLLVGQSARNVGIVYIDARGVGRRALLRKAGKRYIKAKLGTKDVLLGVDQDGVIQQSGSPSGSTPYLTYPGNRSEEGLRKDKI
ncbi:ADH6_3 [Sanghuangporus sanghuang]